MDTSTRPHQTEARSLRRRVVDLPVGRKLFIGFGALTCVLALVIGCLFLTVTRLSSANDHIVDVAATRLRAADQLRVAAAELRAAQQAYVLDPTSSRAGFNEADSRFESALDQLRIGNAPVEEALIHKIATGH